MSLYELQGQLLGVKGMDEPDVIYWEILRSWGTYKKNKNPVTRPGLPEDPCSPEVAAYLRFCSLSATVYKLGSFLHRMLVRSPQLKVPECRGAQSLWKSRSYLKILGVRMMKCRTFHPQNPQILRATVHNLFCPVTWRPGFVHPCFNIQYCLP
jgi:hypothetical protein